MVEPGAGGGKGAIGHPRPAPRRVTIMAGAPPARWRQERRIMVVRKLSRRLG